MGLGAMEIPTSSADEGGFDRHQDGGNHGRSAGVRMRTGAAQPGQRRATGRPSYRDKPDSSPGEVTAVTTH